MSRPTITAAAEEFPTANLEIAIAILSDAHADVESLFHKWAGLVVADNARENEWRLTA